ncbi:MAG: RNase adapter RapZ [Edaphobacter sp.]|uniref:RNase adapter RapZ n=1 Tax=Edaphobacter sp. TaxID=1934404 RepID=UPI00239C1006|nr:RNase adapter RapZ [Edaphobacter sp.]MDE1177594.1 RNase adapter RapZ [Edaphobacter sp.]
MPRRESKKAAVKINRAKPKKVVASTKPKTGKGNGEGKGELVILTGLSGSGKLSALKSFEDLGFYSVDNLPLELVPRFADLVRQSTEIERAALVVDVREGMRLEEFPALLKKVRRVLPTRVLFLEASDESLIRRFSETRRPHPMGRSNTVVKSIREERKRLDPIRNVADIVLDTTKFTVHDLRAHIGAQFEREESDRNLTISTNSFGFKNGVPAEADLVFDVRFLPNPHFIPEFRKLTGRHPKVAKYVRDFPQTAEFLDKTTDLLKFLLPHYIKEGKSYLTVAFGCTGGQHRSVFIAEEMKKRLTAAGYRVKSAHRDMPR